MMSQGQLDALPRNTAVPIYQLIKDAVTDKIRAGDWVPGTRLPSENALAADLGVSRMTTHRALRELTQHGLLTRVHGVGTFVAEPPRQASLIELRDIAEEIAAQGQRHRAELCHLAEERAGRDLAARMEVAPGTTVFHAILVHYRDDLPIQLEDRHVNPLIGPDFLDVDFTAVTPTRYLLDRIRPDDVEHVVQAVMPDAETCDRLAIPPTEPCLRLLRRTWAGGHVATTVALTYPSSRYDLGARYAADHTR